MKFRLTTPASKGIFAVLSLALLLEVGAFAAAQTYWDKAYVITYDSSTDVTRTGPDANGGCTYTRKSDRCDAGGLALFFGSGCGITPKSHHLSWTSKMFNNVPCGGTPIYVGTPIGDHAFVATDPGGV